ncbi:MAG: alkaline phytoceramidase [Gammaproteobacteria bacterium]|nr:MAG: alkaline phytoceramidase [Gammaproteobacteria bacterium]
MIIAIFFAATDPIPQPENYNIFSDQRNFFGINNFLNIISGTPFLLIGAVGFYWDKKEKLVHDNYSTTPIYRIFFIAVFCIGLGSSYFHAAPDNDRLVWDRLPMSVAFMSLTCGLVSEHGHRALQRWLLYPLILTGVMSVGYWHITEQMGRGDLRAYLLVQFLPLVGIPVLMLMRPSRFTRSGDIGWLLFCYLLAKVFEVFDGDIFQWTGVVSGHTLKHLMAAMGLLVFLRMLYCRQPKNSKLLSKE